MMQAVCKVTAKHDIPTIVSLNAVMVDGTGMCGCCGNRRRRGQVLLRDGPDFDGHKVDFDELRQTGILL